MKNKFLVTISSIFLSSCGGGNGDPKTEETLSTGLKIFVTAENHVGDFLNDPTLNGVTAIEKADDFCNKSTNKPNNSVYKALLVDGVNRDAVSLTDWILQASTSYYRSYNDIRIGTTTNTHILDAFWTDLDNTFEACDSTCQVSGNYYVWTGIDNAGDFSTIGNTCDFWSSSSGDSGGFGDYRLKDGSSISHPTASYGCSGHAKLYCVEQP